MIEFTILFQYNNKEQKACVIKSENGTTTEYVVRPEEPETVRNFGKQIIIHKEGDQYNSENHIDEDYLVFFNSLVSAIKEQDKEESIL